MSTVVADPIAFRCTKCWQMTCTTTEHIGQNVPCKSCGQELAVPEATEDLIRQGREFQQEFGDDTAVEVPNYMEPEQLSDREIFKQARQQSRANAGPEKLVCSRIRRFLGRLVDSFALLFAYGLGAVLAFVVSPPVNDEVSVQFLVIFVAPGIMFAMVQWCMTAMDGRTIGKYCLNTKVVNLQGNPPGWFQGVILRSWVVYFLNMIPFFGLLDAAWIFANESKRCIHDFLAGTYVIEAS